MFKRNTPARPYEDLTPQQITALIDQYREQYDCALSCIRMLCYLMKDFSFDLVEINADDFKKRVDELVNALNTADSPKAMRKAFDSGRESITTFIAREKGYLSDRESEFRDIIDFLRKTVASLVGESRAFNTQLYEQNLQMEKLLQLEDIRRMKQSLQAELSKMQTSIRSKQSSDEKRIDMLSREVEVLRTSLQEYKGAAMTDALTKAHNRLAFDTHFRSCVEQAELRRKPLSLLMCDVDDFRSINTKLGHQLGDVVLQLFVTKCKSVLRETDIIARYGGDEFAIVLPNTRLQHAQRIAQRICGLISGCRYAHESTSGQVEFSFTASMGVSEIHRYDTLSAIIERADKALYTAKNSGKGCVRTERDAPISDAQDTVVQEAA